MPVSKVTRDLNCSVTFFPYILQDLVMKMMIDQDKQRDGLITWLQWHQTNHDLHISRNHFLSSIQSSSPLFHSFVALLIRAFVFLQIRFYGKEPIKFSFQLNNACEVCALAKHSRLSFPVSSISFIRPFELIHCDIWGPYKIITFLVQNTFYLCKLFLFELGWISNITQIHYRLLYFFGIFLYFLADKEVENRVPLFSRSRMQS